MQIKSIGIIGSGNVATNLCHAFGAYDLKFICSRTPANGEPLANQFNAAYFSDCSLLPEVDLIIIAVADGAVKEVADQLSNSTAIVTHTAGSVSMNVLAHIERHGIFYALQTFTKDNVKSFKHIPMCIESSTPEITIALKEVASSISDLVYDVSSEQRKKAHLAAVFACNFSNHMMTIAEKLMNEQGLPFDLISPLITETVGKVANNLPSEIQTGPAMRGDKKVIDEHLSRLAKHPEYEKIYKLVTQNIQDTHHG